ncbi:16S rRNA (cytosine(1402)-N(4))-methyltransferase RsmH [Candidatus Parcubacteria bacterium]|nr:16S rRNA (cytosine(1402)-N(4))-methyltransferase RsmH [Candidatus Parcubacteria bacterium]
MHIPVLQKEVIKYLQVKTNENFIDATLGGAGHSLAILERNKPNGKVLGIEIDTRLFETVKQRDRLVLVNDSYVNLKKIVEKYKFKPAGILFDLGFSSWHIEESGKGFSFQKDEPLIMRYDSRKGLTAQEILNKWPEKEIEKILMEYGEEKFSKRIAKEIAKARKIEPIKTTFQLKEIIIKAVPKNYEKGRIFPATRTFQALRIAVNQELENIRNVLPQALEILQPEGRIVIISFHSLEDRIVKKIFKEKAKKGRIKILTKKPIRPTDDEIRINPRSRSARLRAAIKI